MNSTNLYVTTTQIILKADPNNSQSWQDLYRLIPYLKNSLCCVVCSHLLINPLTPANGQCQHHVCQICQGGKKKIKPQCENCKDCLDYYNNRTLKILLQLYKKMCLSMMKSHIFKSLAIQACQPGASYEKGAANLIQIVREGAMFQDEYESPGGLPKSTYSILPCIYSSMPQSTNQPQPVASRPAIPVTSAVLTSVQTELPNNIQPSSNASRSQLYSVVYPGSGSKITIKRKQKESANISITSSTPTSLSFGSADSEPKEESESVLFKKPCVTKLRKGCRCGNATPTPGKLTCCGQRCPCYVESKPCMDCKCRGCRNPHRPDGNKVLLFVPELESSQTTTTALGKDLSFQQGQDTSNPQVALGHTIPVPIVEDEQVASVKLDSLQLETQFFTPDPMNTQYKAYNLFDPIHSLTSRDLIPYGLMEEEDDTDITGQDVFVGEGWCFVQEDMM
ncbi:E3 ubiquitin-protein ligase MSL2 [Anthonomus grandis grandis]|uniref:E3 ubiquitin-protein ligase MSL2 n=1 Tax=Anthonomus grandis grandis TaxID=2921223 RepID=UPI002165CBD5|nr:E3 ubiquitin-protein ligase MSL2 [Anthonomus grandis grandis]XP_050314381.1 E3 ubiquitin-protein ligase MSL2 [Anthonomus grandis grandis]XP_050314382.1 E3 ubiquitin-protein ligase MSL2 [Anthonomus grandis grandis]